MQYYHGEYTGRAIRRDVPERKDEVIRAVSKQVEQAVKVEVYENKWQQLMRGYPQVHICEGAQSILIKPKDIMVLREEYHGLSSNSFLLHAYYNYRQLLLFRYKESDEYYLGVPGIYYERELRLAMMFGFEGFEAGGEEGEGCDNRGRFGYFMKRVGI